MAAPRISSAAFPVSPPPERGIGKYDIHSETGTGALVKVYRAFDRGLGRPVTLKVLTAADPALKHRFREEVTVAARLRSESFIAIYDLGEDAGRPFAAMQVTSGQDLAQAIAQRQMSLLQRLMILWQVSEGLSAAHGAGLKQVGVRTSGIALEESGRAVIHDFGIVSVTPPGEEGDIVSFGAIASELLAGTPHGLEQLVQRAIEGGYQSIEELQEDLDPVLGDWKHKRCVSLLGDASGHMNAGRLDPVQALLKEVLQLEPDNRKAHRLRGELKTRQQALAAERKQRLDRQMEVARNLISTEHYNRAIVVLCDLSREFRGDDEIARLLEEACELRARQEAVLGAADTCDMLQRDGQFEQAIELLDNTLAVYPEDPLLTARRSELQALADARKVLDEVHWVLDQDRPDLAAQLLREKTAVNPHLELARRLAEIESILPQWEESRFIAETLPRIASLEELGQWAVALTVLEEALQAYPTAPPLLEAAERLRARLTGEERRRKLNRRLDSIKQKMAAQSWAQAVMLIEAAQSEFPGERELEGLRQSAEDARRRAEGESFANLVRQCLEDGEPERAEELLKRGLVSLPADSTLLGLQQEVSAGKRYREEWQKAQVLFGRRQYLDAEQLLARLAAQNRPEVDLLLQKVQEARAATEEDQFYASGRAKAQKLIQQQNFEQASELLQNLLGLFPGDVILQRDLQSIPRGRTVVEVPLPEPARLTPFDWTTPEQPHGLWRFMAAGVLLVAGVGAVWITSHSQTGAAPGAPVAPPSAANVQAPPPPVATPRQSPQPAHAPAPVSVPAGAPPQVGGNGEVAKLIHGPLPSLPPLARQNKVRGIVAIRAIVGTGGLLRDIQVVSGDPLLVPAAREAVLKWRYRPASLNGKAVESNVEIKVPFPER